jgi:capsular exopolysaccharide synthesis family protein
VSRLFEALNRVQGEVSELALATIGTDSEPVSPAARPVEHQAEAVAEIPAGARDLPLDLPEAVLQQVRTLPVRIALSTPLLPFDNTDTQASEQYRIVRTRIIQHPRQPRLIVITSGGPGDGKSVTAINLAGALSLKLEGSVLLVDADFRRSSIHTQLGLPVSPGLAEILKGECALENALVQVRQFRNLFVLAAGEAKCNPAELLADSRWPSTCAALRSLFRYVIIDSPPVAMVTDYDLIQAPCDGTILVARPDHTRRDACLAAVNIVPKGRLLGVVLNCVSEFFLDRRSGYGYGYYYAGPAAGRREEEIESLRSAR